MIGLEDCIIARIGTVASVSLLNVDTDGHSLLSTHSLLAARDTPPRQRTSPTWPHVTHHDHVISRPASSTQRPYRGRQCQKVRVESTTATSVCRTGVYYIELRSANSAETLHTCIPDYVW